MNENDRQLWNEFVEAYRALGSASTKLIQGVTDKIEVIRFGLREPTLTGRGPAFHLLESLHTDELQLLLDDLLEYAIWQTGYANAAWDYILSLPKEWLLENIDRYARQILARDDWGDYATLISLYGEISLDLAEDFARRITTHHDAEIRELGEDFLREDLPRLKQSKN